MSVQLECLYLKDNILSRSEQYQALLFTDNSKLSNRAIGIGWQIGLVGKSHLNDLAFRVLAFLEGAFRLERTFSCLCHPRPCH
ncbi:MAG: hypothetical protein RL411_1544 [Bacteroidota bacterium]